MKFSDCKAQQHNTKVNKPLQRYNFDVIIKALQRRVFADSIILLFPFWSVG